MGVRPEEPAVSAAAVTPSDTGVLSPLPRGLYVGGAGNVRVDMADTGTTIDFVGVAAGTLLPIRAKRVYSTSTTATDIVVVW